MCVIKTIFNHSTTKKYNQKQKKTYLLNCHLVLDIKTIKSLITFCVLSKTALKRNDKVLIMF